jgi:hypothetical protein
MKKIRITFRKDGATATCLLSYRRDDWPAGVEWSGARDAFVMPSGRLIPCLDTVHHISATAAYQAALCGATCEIEDLGGEAIFRRL